MSSSKAPALMIFDEYGGGAVAETPFFFVAFCTAMLTPGFLPPHAPERGIPATFNPLAFFLPPLSGFSRALANSRSCWARSVSSGQGDDRSGFIEAAHSSRNSFTLS